MTSFICPCGQEHRITAKSSGVILCQGTTQFHSDPTVEPAECGAIYTVWYGRLCYLGRWETTSTGTMWWGADGGATG